jgi:GTP-binding protein Era
MEKKKAGFVAIIGRPNVGKSTLLNNIIGEKISIVTEKPQTTRNRIRGIKTIDNAQIVFVDTPGIHKAMKGLNLFMVEEALEAVDECDLVLHMVEVYPKIEEDGNVWHGITEGTLYITELLKKRGFSPEGKKAFLLINKIDLVKKQLLLPVIEKFNSYNVYSEIIPISALHGDGIDLLLKKIVEYLPESPPFYDEGVTTDQQLNFRLAEIVREKIYELLEDEVPYSTAVLIEEISERENGMLYIKGDIYIERDSQKGILIGKGGRMLKTIGTRARQEMELLLNRKIYLDLTVKVRKKWTEKEEDLKRLGYSRK